MIGNIKGKVIYKNTESRLVILSTESGIGYRVYLEQDLCSRSVLGDDLSVWTHLAVRENALDLYGFETTEKLVFFELLISISGIGPKSAITILDMASPEFLRRAINAGEVSSLTEIAGIGKKVAEKMILELRGKMGVESGEDAQQNSSDMEVYEALTSLGYSAKEARNAIKSTVGNEDMPTEKRIKDILKVLGS